MDQYTRLFVLPEKIRQSGCPVSILTAVLLKNEHSGACYVVAQLKNEQERPIKSVTIQINMKDVRSGKEDMAIHHVYRDLHVGQQEIFGDNVLIPVPATLNKEFSIMVCEVVFLEQQDRTQAFAVQQPQSVSSNNQQMENVHPQVAFNRSQQGGMNDVFVRETPYENTYVQANVVKKSPKKIFMVVGILAAVVIALVLFRGQGLVFGEPIVGRWEARAAAVGDDVFPISSNVYVDIGKDQSIELNFPDSDDVWCGEWEKNESFQPENELISYQYYVNFDGLPSGYLYYHDNEETKRVSVVLPIEMYGEDLSTIIFERE